MKTYSRLGPELTGGLIPGYLQFTRGYRECRVHFIPFRKLQNMWAVAGSDEFQSLQSILIYFVVVPSFLEYLVKVCLPQQLI